MFVWAQLYAFQTMKHIKYLSHMMDNIFGDIFDDIFILDGKETHSKHLNQVLQKFNEYDLKISISKCLFDAHFWDSAFLAMVLNQALRNLLIKMNFFHQTTKSLYWFFGMANFYWKQVPCFNDLVFPLTECIIWEPNVNRPNTKKRSG